MKSKEYRKGQIDMFNRIWDATQNADNKDDDMEMAFLIVKELNKIRAELQQEVLNEI